MCCYANQFVCVIVYLCVLIYALDIIVPADGLAPEGARTSAGTMLTVPKAEIITHHDDVIKWKQFPRYWPFVRRIHRSPVNSPHKGQ